MGTYVADVELTSLSLAVPPGTDDAVVLTRWHGVPVGLAHIQGVTRLSSEQLAATIREQVLLPRDAPARPPRADPITIVICTRDRPEDLTRCLDGLCEVMSRHEVLVVDNAPSTDSTAVVAARYSVRYVREPRVGLNNARNRGLAEASHEIVAYVDDDAVIDGDWVNALVEPFSDAQVGCSTGLVLPLELRTRAQQVFEAYAQHRRTFARRVYTTENLLPAAAGLVGVGANMALRRDLARQIGGFDPRLDAGTRTCSGGDNDMFARILDAGRSIVYTPQAIIWHRHRQTTAELRQCVFGYGVGVYAFLTKRLIERGDLGTLPIAARWLVGPFLRAFGHYLAGRRPPPLTLLVLEAYGAALGPLRFFAEHRRLGRRPEQP